MSLITDRLISDNVVMLKDASADDDNGLSVVSPIFDYVHFERLEHEGRREFGSQIEQLQGKIHKEIF
ncbi:MAG TPA: hypothetical protein VIJ24_03750 [Verrucomicrobiae bacterium]